jgi:hypothetical protein
VRVGASGKFFALGRDGFTFRCVGMAPEDNASELDGILSAGFTVVSTERPVEPSARGGLRFLLEPGQPAWDQLATAGRRHRVRCLDEYRAQLDRAIGLWHGDETLLGVMFDGPAAPHHRRLRASADELARHVRDEYPGLLVGWRVKWPSQTHCPPEANFLVADVAVANSADVAGALDACHAQVGDRPLVLGDVAVRRAAGLDRASLFETALERGVAGTIERALPRAALSDLARVNRRGVRDLEVEWPRLAIVINAYNAEATIDECLSHCEALDYPDLEIVVVDDGSTDATPAIATSHAQARLVTIAHAGLAAGRNAGWRAATADLVAYLDADAYPSAEWPWYVALAALDGGVGGSGGPNVPPPDDPLPAKIVAQSPGGPIPQLSNGDRARHLPGCNMAFWRGALESLGGFDPVIEGAEDLEFETRLLESGLALAYHPAALAWHHRRGGLAAYLRQQRRNGRGQAILERRCPERFPPGFRLAKAVSRVRRRRGPTEGESASFPVLYLGLPAPSRPLVDLAHQWGIAVAALVALTAPLAIAKPRAAAPAAAAVAYVGGLFVTDAVLAGAERRRAERGIHFRTGVALFRILRPLAFRWGHLAGRLEFRERPEHWSPPPAPAPHRPSAEPARG